MANYGMRVIDTIGPRLDIMIATGAMRMEQVMEDGAHEIEMAAKANAPWEDQTGDARRGGTAEMGVEGAEAYIELYHTVDYGLWLELIQDGRFAIIMPTLEQLAPGIIRRAGAEMMRVSR